MEIKVELRKQPEKYLNKCDAKSYNKLIGALDALKRLEGDIKHMRGSKNEYRLKVPPYRILFTQETRIESDEEVLVLSVYRIGPRGDVYKKGG